MPSYDQGQSSPLALLGGFVGTSVLAGALAAGLAIPAAGAAATATEEVAQVFDELPSDLQAGDLATKTVLLYNDGSPMAEVYYQNRIEIPLDQMSESMRAAILAIEDSRFYEHAGVDPQGVFRAAIGNVTGGDTQGASTLTQQWVKNVLLDRAYKAGDEDAMRRLQEPDPARKVREMRYALAAEKVLTKDQILQNYLNIANFSDGAYGVEAASKYYFSKSAKDLTVSEAALLAGIVQRPTAHNPIKNPRDSQARRDVVLTRMRDLKYITPEQYREAKAINVEDMLKVTEQSNGCEQAGSAGFFCDYILKVMLQDESFGATREERLNRVYEGGLTIQTTLDRKMQEAGDREVKASADPATSSPDIGMSLVSVEPGTGKIKAMAQNTIYRARKDEDPRYTAINYNTSLEYGGSRGFQPGSNMKPIVLAEYLKSGGSLDDMVLASKHAMPKNKFTACGEQMKQLPGDEVWAPENASSASGMITVEKATYLSVNPAYADITSRVDICNILQTAKDLGVMRASPHVLAGKRGLEPLGPLGLTVQPPIVLGADEVAPMAMANAYATFAADGKYCEPTPFEKITDRRGEEIPVTSECRQALPPYVAQTINSALTQTLLKGTAANRARGNGPLPDRVAAGKTGTTNDSEYTWFTGYTPELATSVMLGHVSASVSLDGETFSGETVRKVYGGTISAPTWRRYMVEVSPLFPPTEFTPPSAPTGTPEGEEQVATGLIPPTYGKSMDAARASLEAAGYEVQEGGKIFSTAPVGLSAGTSPGQETALEPGRTVKLYESKGPKPGSQPANGNGGNGNAGNNGRGNGGGND